MLDNTTNLLRLLKDLNLLATKGYLAGEWTDGDEANTFDVINPARGDIVAQVADFTRNQPALAISIAKKAQKHW